MFEIQFELSAILSVHIAFFERLLLFDKVHVALDLFSRGDLDPVQVSLCRSKSFLESDFAFIDVNFTARLIAWFTSIPQASDDGLCVFHKNHCEHLIKVVLLQFYLHELLRVHSWHSKVDIDEVFAFL